MRYEMKKIKYTSLLILAFLSICLLFGEVNFSVKDYPNDDGTKLNLEFDEAVLLLGDVSIFRSFDGSEYELIFADLTTNKITDEFEKVYKTPIHYKLVITQIFMEIDEEGEVFETTEVMEYYANATPIAQWFNKSKISLLLLLLLFCGAVLYYIFFANKGKEFYIRKINGLEAIEEAVGRAAEMGRPVLFVPGISDISDMQTIAALTILGKLAEKVAEYHTKLIVPCRNSLVMVAAKDIVKEAFLKAGYPDEFRNDDIFYLTDDQFGYVAGIDGIMVREKPATNFLLGGFYAESLILAETGFSIGAIQISGTAHAAQIPFFVAACDYTLIGEELFTASAYLSKNPQQIGSLKGQDFGKVVVIGLIVIGIALEICGVSILRDFLTL